MKTRHRTYIFWMLIFELISGQTRARYREAGR